MLTLVENGDVLAPEALGIQSVLLAGAQIESVGEIPADSLRGVRLDVDTIDATGCFVTPGFIDPHQHILGGSGEKGFSSQTPEIHASEIIAAGVTTVVGCLGVDTTMKTMAGLLARAKALKEEGLDAYLWTGGYNVPPTCITTSVRDDIMFIEEVIGAGEIAISDERSTDPKAHELARLCNDAYVGGMLGNKCGITHFHVGEGDSRLQLLRQLLDEFHVPTKLLYPTHVTRNELLFEEAIELAQRGCFVDIDTFAEDLVKWVKYYLQHDGDPAQVTISSDASLSSPVTLLNQIRACVRSNIAFEDVLPFVTSNTARALKLTDKGQLRSGCSADLLVFDKSSLELKEVITGGQRLVRDGKVELKEAFLEESNRVINLVGSKTLNGNS